MCVQPTVFIFLGLLLFGASLAAATRAAMEDGFYNLLDEAYICKVFIELLPVVEYMSYYTEETAFSNRVSVRHFFLHFHVVNLLSSVCELKLFILDFLTFI
jgi:hypothetical protein